MSDELLVNKCEVCENSAAQKCGGCHNVFYCSKEHQKSDWKKHKKACKPFKVCTDESVGRHVIATKDIKPGDIILQEPPLIWGPSQTTIPVCLGCAKGLTQKTSRPCSKCGWPVCSETCEKAPAHIPECRYTVLRGEKVSISSFGVVHPTYQCITVLRCLYQKQFLPELWKKINRLESHCNERKSTHRYENERVTIAKFILRFFKLHSVFTEEDILRICGIVMKLLIRRKEAHLLALQEKESRRAWLNALPSASLGSHLDNSTFRITIALRTGQPLCVTHTCCCGEALFYLTGFTAFPVAKVQVNAHEVPLTAPSYVAIYESTSMFEHNCRANCNKTFTNQGNLVIKSGISVNKGDHLSICYTDPMWGTPNRRYHLHESKFFWCSCQRCSDPTEFGTYFSSVRCQNSDCKGYLLPKSFLENTNNEKGQDWFCSRCQEPLSSYCIQDLMERIGQDLANMPKGVSSECKKFIESNDKYLHPNHFHMTDVKFALCQIIGHEFPGGLPQISDEDLELKARLCQSLVNLTKTLCPGETRMRGLLLFELHAVVAEIGRRNPDPQHLQANLLESRALLKEAADILRNEPDALPEGKIYKQALVNLKEIDVVLLTLHKNLGDSPL